MGQKGASHAAKESGRVEGPLLGLLAQFSWILRPQVFSFQENDPRRFSGDFAEVCPLKRQKYRKRGF